MRFLDLFSRYCINLFKVAFVDDKTRNCNASDAWTVFFFLLVFEIQFWKCSPYPPKAKFALVEMSRKRKENVSFLNIHPNRINERFSFHFVSSRLASPRLVSSRVVSFRFISFFCPAYADKSGYFLPFSLHCLCSSTSYLFTSRLRLFYWSTAKTANDSKWQL